MSAPLGSRSDKLLAIASGKGGVGKTFIAVTLAQALARRGKRVLLFDGDLGLANVDVQLGLMPPRDLSGVFAGRLTLEQAVVPFPTGGFSVLAGRSGSGSLAALAPSRLAVLAADLIQLAQGFDHVLLDLGAGIDRMVRLLAACAATRLVVITADPTSLTDAYAFIKVTAADDPSADQRVIVNQARTIAEGERTHMTLQKACETFLKLTPQLVGVVRRDRRVVDSIRTQTPLLIKFPDSDAALDLEGIATRLAGGQR